MINTKDKQIVFNICSLFMIIDFLHYSSYNKEVINKRINHGNDNKRITVI